MDEAALNFQDLVENAEFQVSNLANVELGSLIWLDTNGNPVTTPHPVVGGRTSLPVAELEYAAAYYDPTLVDEYGNFDYSRIIGFVHTHPGDPGDMVGQIPSAADMSALRTYANNGADGNSLVMYIIGPDGVMRAYPLVAQPGEYSGQPVTDCG